MKTNTTVTVKKIRFAFKHRAIVYYLPFLLGSICVHTYADERDLTQHQSDAIQTQADSNIGDKKNIIDKKAVEAVDGPIAHEDYPNALVQTPSKSGHYVHIANTEGITQTLAVEALEDLNIVNLKADRIGEVDDVVTSATGAITALIVESGGFWGIGETEIAVPIEEVYLVGQQLVWKTTHDAEKLRDMERYDYREDQYTSLMED